MHGGGLLAQILLAALATVLAVGRPTASRGGQVRRHLSSRPSVPDLSQLQEWYSLGDCQVLFPTTDEVLPKSIVHFVGGFLLGSASPVAYSELLTSLADAGHLVVATPIPAVESNHGQVAADVSSSFNKCYYENLLPMLGPYGKRVPIVGVAHSLGGKLQALAASRRQDRRSSPLRAGNVYLAFNNYSFRRSLELSSSSLPLGAAGAGAGAGGGGFEAVQQSLTKGLGDLLGSVGGLGNLGEIAQDLGQFVPQSVTKSLEADIQGAVRAAQSAAQTALEFEFDPAPAAAIEAIVAGYGVDENILFRFAEDEIDESKALAAALGRRGGCRIVEQTLPGGHLTPCGGGRGDVKPLIRALNTALSVLAVTWAERYPQGVEGQRVLGGGGGGGGGRG